MLVRRAMSRKLFEYLLIADILGACCTTTGNGNEQLRDNKMVIVFAHGLRVQQEDHVYVVKCP